MSGLEGSHRGAPTECARSRWRSRLSLVLGGAALALVVLFFFDLRSPWHGLATSSGELKDTADRAEVRTAASKLTAFYAALAKLEDGQAPDPVTILHLGDSHIATDNITGELRRLLQARFGDAGRGLMMPGFPFSGYKAPGFSFEKHGAWTAADSVHEEGAYGITGVSVTADAAGAELKLASSAGTFASAEVSLLTGPKRGQAVIAADGWSKQVSAAAGTQSVLRVKIPVRSTSLSIKVVGDGPVTVLGWSVVSNHPGVRYINLGIPGASAFTARRFDPEIAVSDIKELAPKLVVLGYGTNEGFLDYLGLAGYEQEWVRLFKLARSGAPETAIVVLGPPDAARLPDFVKGTARDDAPCRPLTSPERAGYDALFVRADSSLARWHEPPSLAGLRLLLPGIATRHGAVLWDVSRFMGGPCSIDRWVKSDPPLALPDRTHLSEQGSRRVARAIYDSLMAGYEQYRGESTAAGAHLAMP